MVDQDILGILRGQNLSDDSAARLDDLLRVGTCPETILGGAVGSTPSYDLVVEIMAALEKMAESHSGLALKLMVGLYPIASDLSAHDVCNSIELWLEHEGTSEVKDFVLRLLRSDCMPGMTEKLVAWSQSIS